MKIDKILALSMASMLTVAFTACDSEDEAYEWASVSGSQVYFNNSLAKEYVLSMNESSFNIPVSRVSDADAISVPLNVTLEEGSLFTIPQSVSFAAGQKEATIQVSYDPANIEFDKFETVKISLADAGLTTEWGISEYVFTAGVPAPWVSLGMATVVDDFITGIFGVENIAWQVELQENQLYPGYYRLVNPYGAGYPYNEPGDFDVSQDYYMEIHAENPDQVYIPTVTYGMDWGYGNFIFGSLAGYYLAKGDEGKAADYYGTLADGIISFPADALLIGMSDYNDGGLYSCNESGAFKIVFPGIVLADYSIDVAYAGKLYDVDDNLYVVAELAAIGGDVEEVRLAVTSADNADALIAAIASEETDDYVSLTAPGTANLPMPADAVSGKYSIVAVSYAGGEAQEASVATFKYTALGGEPEESWTAYYVGNYTYYQCFEGTDENVVLYGSDDDPLRCKLAPWGTGTDFVFIWDDDDNISVVADQDMEFSDSSYGDFYVSDMTSDCILASGNSWADIIEYNFAEDCTGTEQQPSFIDFDIPSFNYNVVYYTSKGYVIGWGYETYEIMGQASGTRIMKNAPAVSSWAQPVRNSRIHWLEKPMLLKSAMHTLRTDAKKFVK